MKEKEDFHCESKGIKSKEEKIMMRYLQRLGKSLMLPVACLPVAAILQGIGYWIDPTGWGANNVIAAFLLKGGGCLIDQMPILFAIGVAVGMSDDNDGTAGLAGLVSWIMTTTLLPQMLWQCSQTQQWKK